MVLSLVFFRVIQLGGKGRPEGLSTFVDAFLSQDNYGANTGNNDRSKEPGNQLAGIDIRWRPFDAQFAVYGQVVGEDEDKFLPNALMFLIRNRGLDVLARIIPSFFCGIRRFNLLLVERSDKNQERHLWASYLQGWISIQGPSTRTLG